MKKLISILAISSALIGISSLSLAHAESDDWSGEGQKTASDGSVNNNEREAIKTAKTHKKKRYVRRNAAKNPILNK
jgi:hypothetical protein